MTRARANGEGTIYRRKDGRYEATAYMPTISGKSKRVSFYGKTRAEAHGKLVAAKAQVQRGLARPDKIWKLGDYLDYWLESVVRPTRRYTTYSRYEVTVRLHLKPRLGNYKLSLLSVAIVQSFFNDKLSSGCSVRNVQIMREALSAALTNAQREELINRNVARLSTLPMYQPADVRPWSAAEAMRFLKAAKTSSYYAIFALLMVYGLRRGEVLGLRWQDIDFDAREVHIRQQLQRVNDLLYQAPLKTKAGTRDLPLLDFPRDLLLTHRTKQQATCQRARIIRSTTDPADDLVFTSENCHPIEPRNLVRSFKQISTLHGLRVIRLHDLRHTAATLLKNLRVPARDAQLILGHSDISTTQNIYQHDDMESRRHTLKRIEKILLREQKSVADGSRCRQNSRQQSFYMRQLTSAISGTPGRIRTYDTWFRSSIPLSSKDRLTSIKQLAQRRTRTWLLGCVAVNVAVKCINTDDTGSCTACGRRAA